MAPSEKGLTTREGAPPISADDYGQSGYLTSGAKCIDLDASFTAIEQGFTMWSRWSASFARFGHAE